MNFSAWSIRHPMPPILLFIVLLVIGLMSFSKLPVTRFPNIDFPLVSIVVTDPGVAASEMVTQTTKIVEDAVANISGVDQVISNITEGRSVTVVQFKLDVETQEAVTDTKDAVERIQADLPGSADDPIVNRIDIEGQAIVTYAVSNPAMTLEELSWFVDDTVISDLQGLSGVSRVDRYGGVKREVEVEVDPDRLAALGVSVGQINNALRAANADLTGGRVEIAGREQTVRALGATQTMEDLRQLEIPLAGDRRIRLEEVATVTDGWSEQRSFSRVNGEPVVSFGVFRGKGASDVSVAERVSEAVAEIQQANPDIDLRIVDTSVEYTEGNYESAMHTLYEGALLAVAVVFLFLRNLRATLIAAVALPLSIIPTFWMLDMLGFSLNLVSLLGVTLVTGILVDDAIVEIENIVRHIGMGKSPYRAALEAADEIGLAVIAISTTIIAVFAPVSFMDGIAGQYFKQFGLTVAVAVFFSLLVARLITPLMAAYLMRGSGHPEDQEPGRLMRFYTDFLYGTLRFRWLTLFVGVAFFSTAIWSTSLLPTGFLPKEDASRVVLSLELPPGSQLDDTRGSADELVTRLRQIPEVENVYVVGGASPTGDLELRRGSITVDLIHKSERDRTQAQIETEILDIVEDVPDIRAYFVDDRGERELQIALLAENEDAPLDAAARDIQQAMVETGLFRSVTSNAALDRPEIIIEPRQDRLAELNISTSTLSEVLRVATIGDFDQNLAKFTIEDRQIPIRVQLSDAAREDLDVIRQLSIPTPSGRTVPLDSVANVRFGQGPTSIQRFDRERRILIGASMAEGLEIGVGTEAIDNLPEVQNLPDGLRVQEAGNAEVMGDVFAGFRDAMITGLMLVLVVLILLFGSVFHSMTILLSLPFSIGGVVAALVLTNTAISMPVVIGILMLMGIVTKNAIMLVDFAIEEIKLGVPRRDAMIDACRKRARPIIMTTIAMSAGMIPAALAIGDGGEFRAPMAIAVIGGLLVGTMLTLIFVPSLFDIMDSVSGRVTSFFKWLLKPNAKEEVSDEEIHSANVEQHKHDAEEVAGRYGHAAE
ncbi:efflux RND transporter permease subunit [Notoacmeibacter ruber]|uniref:Efflux RND transporter permease subunit n=1 Tax=Notoacmeibacter ruber TaxID=2670375 RepID=A0A3L7JA58_9HYPH|nr:efflux RND transporter permease subunit [Notoacmeibacter ruber]RLQ87304.1 efflux RND transporter permease subunit [Notoacmeibacter ruber]